MVLEPFENEPEGPGVPRIRCTKRVVVATLASSGLLIIVASTFIITAGRNCDTLREDNDSLLQKLDVLSRRLQSFQTGNNVTHTMDSEVAPVGVSNLTHVERMMEVLTQVVAVNKTRSARVPLPKVWPEVNTSQVLSCESTREEPLSNCLWGRAIDGQYEVILIDKEVVRNGGRTAADGISHTGDGLDEGKCEIKIESVALKDFVQWSCTLVAQTGEVFNGGVNVETTRSALTVPDMGPAIYFTNVNGSIKAYSPNTSELYTVINDNNEEFLGIAYDSFTDKLYWSSDFRNGTWSICRANRNGTGLERALHTSEHTLIFELAFDWITGNIYAVSLNGVIFVCDPSRTGAASSSCTSILTGQGKVEGIALDPLAGLMYFSSGDLIIRTEMDGSNRVSNFIRVNAPRGIFFDPEDSRLYWSSTKDKLIQSSDLEGDDIRTIVHLGTNAHPQGVAVMGDRIYWTDHFVGKLESSKKDGTDVQTLYDGADKIMHLVVAPIDNPHGNRANHCDQQCGSNTICVLNANSFRCLDGLVENSSVDDSSEELIRFPGEDYFEKFRG